MTTFSTQAATAYFKQLCVVFPQFRQTTPEQFIEFLKREGYEFTDDCPDIAAAGGVRK